MDVLYISLLILLIFLTFWAINSHRVKQKESQTPQFKKARTEYLKPPRPHSESYNNFFRLASSVYSKQQKKIALVLSQLIKDYMELSDHSSERKNLSENLKLILTDPDEWFLLQLDLIDRSEVSRKQGLSKSYIQVLDEVQHLLNISLVFEME